MNLSEKLDEVDEKTCADLDTEWFHYPKQSAEYYKAIEEGDIIKAHYLFVRPVLKPLWMIKHEIKMAEIEMRHEMEIERTKNTPKELREIELKFLVKRWQKR